MDIEQAKPLTNWKNEPSVGDLKNDYINCKSSHDTQVGIIDQYMVNLRADPLQFKKKESPRSKIQRKLIRKQAEWRYASLSEPFLATEDIFRVNPVTYEDTYAANQNELVLNYQFNTQLNKIKLIDDYVRAAVDTGTAIIRVGWEERTEYQDVPKPLYVPQPIDVEAQAEDYARFERVQRVFHDDVRSGVVPDHWKQCVVKAEQETQQRNEQIQQQALMQAQQQIAMAQMRMLPPEQLEEMQNQVMQQAQQQAEQQIQSLPPIAYIPVLTGTEYETIEKTINRPTVNICHYADVYVDSTCEGDLDKAEFVIYKYDSCMADLLANKRFKNVEYIPETSTREFDEYNPDEGDNLKDEARRKLTVYEYWGNYDINGDGTKVPIVATWVGSVMIRLEENPYPDHKPPFVFVSYLPVARRLYGEPDGALLADNQAIISAISRGIIDLLGKSANSQTGVAMQFLDPVNRRAFNEGRDYEFNPNMPPAQAIFQHTFPEIPQSILPFMQSLEFEAEALTGVKGFSQGMSAGALGDSATGIRGVLDAASKREMGILRRLADGIKQVARKIIAMNALWLNDSEVIRITNQDFVDIRRDDLAGNFDLSLAITSAEEDNSKAEALGFMLQTLGNTVDQGMTQMVLSEICKLRKMPELAERIRRWQPPQPDPMQQQMQQMQMELMQAQIAKLQAEVQKLGADAGLSEARAQSEMVEAQMKPQELQVKAQSEMSKAMYNHAMSKKLDLDYMHELDGTQHQRDMEKQAAQANAQADKSARERYMDISAKEQEYGYKAEIERLKAQTKLQEAQIKARAQTLKSKSL